MAVVRRAIIVGGIGRSGTSVVRDAIRQVKDVVSFGEIEAKFFAESYGLLDVYRALVTDYRIDTATRAVADFRTVMLVHMTDPDFYGQPSILTVIKSEARYRSVVESFVKKLQRSSVASPLTEVHFLTLMRTFVLSLIQLIVPTPSKDAIFVEKTPHNVFNPWFFQKLFEDVKFVWTIRDPRLIAFSVMNAPWGPNDLRGACDWVNAAFERFFQTYNSTRSRVVSLEKLTVAPDREIRKLAEYLQIDLRIPNDFIDSRQQIDWFQRVDKRKLQFVDKRLAPLLQKYRQNFVD